MSENRLKFQFIPSTEYPTAVRVGHWPLIGGPEVGWDRLAQELILRVLAGTIAVTVVIETTPKTNWYTEFFLTSAIASEERPVKRGIVHVYALVRDQDRLSKVVREIVAYDQAWDWDGVWLLGHRALEAAGPEPVALPFGTGPLDFGDVLYPTADGMFIEWHTIKTREEVLGIIEASAAVAKVELREGILGQSGR